RLSSRRFPYTTLFRSYRVVPIEGGPVLHPLVPEQRAELLDAALITDQPVPVVMAHLMPAVADHGAVGLGEVRAIALPLGIVGLRDRKSTRLNSSHVKI